MHSNDSKQSSTSNLTPSIFIILGFAVILLVIIIYVFETNSDTSTQKINLAIGEWAPYTGENLVANGIATATVTRVLHDIGYNPEYHFMPWPIAEEKAALGEKDDDIIGTFPYTEINDRKNRFYFSETILNIDYAIFYHEKNNPEGAKVKKTMDLSPDSVLAIRGYEYPDEIKKFVFKKQKIMNDNLEAFIELENRKEPIFVMEAFDVGEQLLEQKLPQLRPRIRSAPFRTSLDFKLMLSKNNPNNLALMKDFNEKLRHFKSNESAYSSFQAAIKNRIDLSRSVLLKPFDHRGIVLAYKNKDKEDVILLPRGSKAIVKEWSGPFLQYQVNMDSTINTLVKIKLLNGPFSLNDYLLFVDGRSIYIPMQ